MGGLWGRDELRLRLTHATLLGVKQTNTEDVLRSPGNSTQCPVVTLVGRRSKEEGLYVYEWLIHFAVQQKLTQHCKATIYQLKKNHMMDLVCICFFFFFLHLEWQFFCGVSTPLDGTEKGKRKKNPHVKFRVLLFSFAYTIPHRWCG